MSAKIIKNDAEHEAALARIERIFGAAPGTPEGDELELLVHLVEAYEANHHPIEPPDPVEAIKFRMEQEGLKQKALVPFLGSKSKVSEVLNGKRPLSLAMIRALHKGLGIPAHVLIQEPGKALSAQYEGINWSDFPVAEMLKRQWFHGFRGKRNELLEQAEEILGPMLFPGGRDCRGMALAARRRVRAGSVPDDHALWAWQARVLQLAESQKPERYDPAAMNAEWIRSVMTLSRLDDGPIQARRMLLKSGVCMVVLSYLPSTHLDGASMLRSDGCPVAALTIRHDRLDNFWFTLAHELAHVVLHLSKGEKTTFLDDLEGQSLTDDKRKEKEANDLAQDCLISAKAWIQAHLSRQSTVADIQDLANRSHIHPAIVAGRIRFEHKDYTLFNALVGRNNVRKLFPADQSGDISI